MIKSAPTPFTPSCEGVGEWQENAKRKPENRGRNPVVWGFTAFSLGMIMLLIPIYAPANGGDQRVNVKDGYLVNLSRAPFTPIAGTKTVMLVSFVDVKTGNLVKDDTVARIRIAKGRGSTDFIHEKSGIPVQGGVFEYSYTFEQPGLHEIFFDFTLVNDPTQKIYELPDFLMDIQQPAPEPTKRSMFTIIPISLGVALGFFAGWLAHRKLL